MLDHLGVKRADAYGTSMGGRVTQWVAARHPDRVRRLVLRRTSPGGSARRRRDASVRRALAQADREAARRALIDLMCCAPPPGSPTTPARPRPSATRACPRAPATAIWW
ncbi:alpha/beta fold hydrolase [Streptomyces griseiscabiei]|uniref:alpha/beta fold hydrolase n=1 Tax=Streptomyces griseiscabiei TaxID=2993540 RepID=UPI003EBB1ADE